MVGRILEGFCVALRVMLGCLMASLAVPVAMQVVARYTGIIPVYLWTEELSTFLFIWVVMIGSMVAVWDGTHFDVQITPDATSPLGTLLQKGVVLVAILIFGLFFARYGIDYAIFGSKQNSTMMRANLAITYASVPVAGTVWAIFAAYRLSGLFADFRHATRGAA